MILLIFPQLLRNNCEVFRFYLDFGTRKGKHLSLLLFNLALEPFLARVSYTDEMQLRYQSFPITTMMYHAFADDGYFHDLYDYKKHC